MKYKRGYDPKPRNTGSRERRRRVLIVAEGKNKTETKYFNDLRRAYGLNLSFVSGNYTDPVNMVHALKSRLDSDYGDIGVCLIDSDFKESKNIQIARADKIAAENGMEVIVSSPCFEIWFLCHYSASTRQYCSVEEIITELRKYLPGYEKNADGVFAATSGRIGEAIRNAQTLRESCERNGYRPHTVEFSPSTDVDKLVKQLIK